MSSASGIDMQSKLASFIHLILAYFLSAMSLVNIVVIGVILLSLQHSRKNSTSALLYQALIILSIRNITVF